MVKVPLIFVFDSQQKQSNCTEKVLVPTVSFQSFPSSYNVVVWLNRAFRVLLVKTDSLRLIAVRSRFWVTHNNVFHHAELRVKHWVGVVAVVQYSEKYV